ncbi:RNA polymerase II-associated protein 3 [Coemansia sp. RSA 1199]|nr:RNA polymerase II-associated protein 3 [Coemansia sp. RSA 1199]
MTDTVASQKFKAQGDTAYRQSRFAQAADFYLQAIQADGTNPVLFTNRAMAQLKLGQFTDAANSCSQALAIDSTSVKALWRRGTAYYSLGQFSKAHHDFTCGLALEPTNAVLSTELEKTKKALESAAASKAQLPRSGSGITTPIAGSTPQPMSVPQSPQDFERAWREHASVPARLYKYLKMVPVARLPSLFRASLESTHIADITNALEHGYQTHKDFDLVFKVLSTLPSIDRFSLALLFTDDKVKERIHHLLKQLTTVHGVDAASLTNEYR